MYFSAAMIQTRVEETTRRRTVIFTGHDECVTRFTRSSLTVASSTGGARNPSIVRRDLSGREQDVDPPVARPSRLVVARRVHRAARGALGFGFFHLGGRLVSEINLHRVGPRLPEAHVVVRGPARVGVADEAEYFALQWPCREASGD